MVHLNKYSIATKEWNFTERIQSTFYEGSSSIKDNAITLIKFTIKAIQPDQINKLSLSCIEINKSYLVSIFSTANIRFQFRNLLKLVSQIITLFVGNMAKGRITKPRCQENKARQIFRKTNIS